MTFRSQIVGVLILSHISLLTPSAQGALTSGGTCSSMGNWTVRAKEAASELQMILRRLKSDSNCLNLQKSLNDLQDFKNTMGTYSENSSPEARFEDLPNEVGALREVITSDPATSDDLMPALADRANEMGTLTATMGSRQDRILGESASLKNRAARVNQKGQQLIESFFAELAKSDLCLAAHPSQLLMLVDSALSISGIIGSNSHGATVALAQANASLITMLRDRKFSKVIRQLELPKLQLTLSCFLENLSQNYCSAYEARNLLKLHRDGLDQNSGVIDTNGPFAGYYVLTRPVPKITRWLQDIIMGITPKLSTEAAFKNEIWDSVTDTVQSVNQMWGMFHNNKKDFNQLKGDTETMLFARRRHLFKLVSSLSSYLAEKVGKQNFFVNSVGVKLLPWYLIGRNSLPKSVSGNENERVAVQDTLTAMEGNGQTYTPEFTDPALLYDVIKQRLDILGDQALNLAQGYFVKAIVVDVADLINQTLADPNYSVEDSLLAVKKYLAALENQVRSAIAQRLEGADRALLPNIVETRGRVTELIDAIARVKNFESTLPNIDLPDFKTILNAQPGVETIDSKQIEEYKEKVLDVFQGILDVIFTNFNVLKQRDSFLVNRMSTHVKLDYALKTRNGQNLQKFARELFELADNQIIDTLKTLHATDSTSLKMSSSTYSKIDLEKALVANANNLNDFENIFSDALERMILVEGLKASNHPPTNMGINVALLRRLNEQAHQDSRKTLGNNSSLVSIGLNVVFGPVLRGYNMLQKLVTKPDLFYAEPTNANAPPPRFDEFGARAQIRAKLCAQTLAFENWPRFQQLCKGSVLYRVSQSQAGETSKVNFNLNYDSFTTGKTDQARYQGEPRAAQICAFRDYSRKHLVFSLQQLSGARQ